MRKLIMTIAMTGLAAMLVAAPAWGSAHAAPNPGLHAKGKKAPCAVRPTRACLRSAADAVRTEKVGGPLYGRMKRTYPSHLVWTNNGCSFPGVISGSALDNKYSPLFQASCDRHDFGYRNYGRHPGSPVFDPSSGMRRAIDNQFLRNMKTQCERKYSIIHFRDRSRCIAVAGAMFTAVRRFGGDPYYT